MVGKLYLIVILVVEAKCLPLTSFLKNSMTGLANGGEDCWIVGAVQGKPCSATNHNDDQSHKEDGSAFPMLMVEGMSTQFFFTVPPARIKQSPSIEQL